MKQRKHIVWEATDIDEKYSSYNAVIYNLKKIVQVFQREYLNISKFNANVHNYSVSFSYIEKDDIIVIKYKTDFLTSEKELFRFEKKSTATNIYDIPEFQTVKIYNNLHILYEYFKNNASKFNFDFYTTDKDPSDKFDFGKYPEYNNGGYDYFVARMNEEIVNENIYNDKNFNLSLYKGNILNPKHEKIKKIKQKITNYYIDDHLQKSRAGKAVPNFINENIVPLKKNVWSKWKRFDIQKIEFNYGGNDSILGFNVKNEDGSIEEIRFKKYVKHGEHGLQLIEEVYANDILTYYFNVINNIRNEELKLSIFNYYIIPYLKSSAYQGDYLNDFIYYDIGFFINEILYDLVIPEKYIDIIDKYLDKIAEIGLETYNIFDTENKINIDLYKIELIVTTISCIYYKEYYAYSKCFYPIIDNMLNLIDNTDVGVDFRPQYIYSDYTEMMKIFQKIYKPKFFENTEHFFKDHKHYDLSIQYLNNVYRLYTIDTIREWRTVIRKNMALFSVYNDTYNQAIILNVILSKIFVSPYKDMLLKQCVHLITKYYEYRSKSYSYTYKNNIGKIGQGYVKKSVYDIGMVYTTNIFINKMIKSSDKRDIIINTLMSSDRLVHSRLLSIPRTDHRLGIISFYALNADKYDANIIKKFLEICDKIVGISYATICSGTVKIQSILIEHLLPLIWSFKVTAQHLNDIFKITEELKPEPGFNTVSMTNYNNVRDAIKKYIKDNIS